jgi:hypothetical protein
VAVRSIWELPDVDQFSNINSPSFIAGVETVVHWPLLVCSSWALTVKEEAMTIAAQKAKKCFIMLQCLIS